MVVEKWSWKYKLILSFNFVVLTKIKIKVNSGPDTLTSQKDLHTYVKICKKNV